MTPSEYANASSGLSNSFNSISPLILVVVLASVGIVVVASLVAPWLAKSRLLSRLGRRIGITLWYALKGVVTCAAVSLVAVPAYIFSQADGSTQAVSLKLVALALGAVIALAILGWIADRTVAKFIDVHPEFEEWSDIFPDSPDKDADTAGESA